MSLPDLDLDEFTAFEGGASATFPSPAVSTSLDFSSAPSSAASNMGTVSPQDLLIHEPFMSAPNSTALTALTSPSVHNESPDYCDSYDVSPNFNNVDFDAPPDTWFPLFPQEANAAPQVQASAADGSPSENSEDVESPRSGASHRRKSGNTSPAGSARHSSVSGVNSRRRDKPLPPIIVEDPSDVIAMKRARNTLAARKSRERKAQRMEELEEKIAKLEAERDHWMKIALANDTGGQ